MELTLKLQKGMAANRDWLMERVKQAKPGEPLDYDPRLGLTKEEYAEYLRQDEKPKLVSAGTRLRCLFRWTGDTLSIEVDDPDSPLSKIRLNTKTGELIASVGSVGTPTWKTNNDRSIPIGAYEGCSWEYEKGDLDTLTGRSVKLDIRRLKSSGKILWSFDDTEMVNQQIKQHFELTFQHSPRSAQQHSEANAEPASPKAIYYLEYALVKEKSLAEEIQRAMKGGIKLQDAAKNGGATLSDPCWYAKGDLLEPLETAAAKLGPGESGMVETERGIFVIHLIKCGGK